ncbi:MAG: hypothetical protein JWL95_1153 [Gemmatimonadetes bacterium]|nr:hypothetical protein [Gemmatimonadota bacterium]
MPRDLSLYKDGALGDMYYRDATGELVPVEGTPGTSRSPMLQSDGTVAWVEIGPAFVILTDGATITWATAGAKQNNARVTIAGNRTLSITGAVDGAEGYLEVTQDATGGRTLTLPSGTIVGSLTTINSAATKKTAVAWSYNGSTLTFVLAREA